MKSLLKGVGRGLTQLVLWLGRLLGFKKGMDGDKALNHAIRLCVFVAALTLAGACINVAYRYGKTMLCRWEYKRWEHLPDHNVRQLSKDVVFHDCMRYGKSYVYNKAKDEKTIEDIVWVATPLGDDNLVCYFDGEKRGYFDRNTGEIVIPAQYERAWIFSDSVAAVLIDGRIAFIDHQGKQVMTPTFYYDSDADGYCFHDGLCLVYTEEGKMGAIDKKGNWIAQPVYQDITHLENGCLCVYTKDDTYGVIAKNGKVVLPEIFREINYVNDTEEYYKVLTWNHVNQVLDMNGAVVNACDYYDIEQMSYTTDELMEEYGEYDLCNSVYKDAVANCLKYSTSDSRMGLMDKRGNAITPPLYTSIRPIAADRYVCEAEYGCVILDDAGNECGKKLE